MRPVLLFIALSSLPVSASHADCIDDAAWHHHVSAYVLRAIGWQESRLNPDALHRNGNGTVDLGAFQINSVHLPTLRRTGITPESLRDGCVSAYVAAWHYRLQVDRFGNTWNAVGAYHSMAPALNHRYANEIAAILRSWGLLAPGSPPFREPIPAHRRPQNIDSPRWVGTPGGPDAAATSDIVVFDSATDGAHH